jgi:fluoride exporter
MLLYFLVALGGALGSAVRLWLGVQVASLVGVRFPWATVLINVLGSLAIGFFAMLTSPGGRVSIPVEAQAFVMVGVCGGFTTFSAFSLQTLELVRVGQLLDAGTNVVLSLVLCLGAVVLGHWLATLFGRA